MTTNCVPYHNSARDDSLPRYDNTLSEMRGLLRVLGPGFKNRETLRHVTSDYMTSEDVIMNTELYNLFCSLLGTS